MDKAGLLQLPGRPEEQDWLRERLEVLTAREGIALDAAIQRHPAQDSTEVVRPVLPGGDQRQAPGAAGLHRPGQAGQAV